MIQFLWPTTLVSRDASRTHLRTKMEFFMTFANGCMPRCACKKETTNSLQNSGAKYLGNKMSRQFQIFPVCLGNTSAKKLPKIQQKALPITSAMVSVYLGILLRGYDLVF